MKEKALINYLSVENLSKAFGDQSLFEGITFGLSKGDKTAIIARNGTGKTTLLKILAGVESADGGEFTFRNDIRVAFLEQAPELDQTLTIDELIVSANTSILTVIQRYEMVLKEHSDQDNEETARSLETATAEMDRLHAWDYDRRLRQLLDLFRITQTSQKVSSLSGGEKKRLAMALVLLDEPDFLILDEPTNDLDILVLNRLEEFLSNYSGCLVLVSHDRYFLDKLTDHLFIFEGDGKVRDYYGSYTKYSFEKEQENQLYEKQLRKQATNDKPKTKKNKVKTKLNFNEQREYDSLEKEIEKLEVEKSEAEAAINSGELAYEELNKYSERIGELLELIDEKTLRWMELDEFV